MTNSHFVSKLKRGIKEEVLLSMKPINIEKVKAKLYSFLNKPVYVHLETTNGAYASHFGNKGVNVGAYIRNAQITYTNAEIKGDISFRVGLKTELGWVYAEGLTDWEWYENSKLLLAGHDQDGRLMVALQISETPFE